MDQNALRLPHRAVNRTRRRFRARDARKRLGIRSDVDVPVPFFKFLDSGLGHFHAPGEVGLGHLQSVPKLGEFHRCDFLDGRLVCAIDRVRLIVCFASSLNSIRAITEALPSGVPGGKRRRLLEHPQTSSLKYADHDRPGMADHDRPESPDCGRRERMGGQSHRGCGPNRVCGIRPIRRR